MPKPGKDETREEFMERCIPMVLDEGTAEDQDQAVAICMNIWRKRDKDMKDFYLGDDMLITHGGAVKALGDGRIAGYLVRFSTDKDPDMEGEFFTKDTDFGEHDTGMVFYNHGQDRKFGKRRLSSSAYKKDEFGIWAETQLKLRDVYERFIYMMAEKGMIGWSSGTAPHLVEKERVGKAVWLKTWPLGLDDTLTPAPAEPRNSVIPLKSWKAIEIPEFDSIAMTLADRMGLANSELKELLSDLRGLVDGIDKPLSETKRKELTELLEMFSGMDAVRTDLQSVLAATPKKLVSTRMTSYQMAEMRKRLAAKNILEQE